MNDIKIRCGPPLIRLDLILPDVADPVIIYINEEHKNKRGWCDFAWVDPKECGWYKPEGKE